MATLFCFLEKDPKKESARVGFEIVLFFESAILIYHNLLKISRPLLGEHFFNEKV